MVPEQQLSFVQCCSNVSKLWDEVQRQVAEKNGLSPAHNRPEQNRRDQYPEPSGNPELSKVTML
jgi:hypothetical protein